MVHSLAKDYLLQAILEQLMTLPAYSLKEKEEIIFSNYFYSKASKLVFRKRRHKHIEINRYFGNSDGLKQTVQSMYQPPNLSERFSFSFFSLPKLYRYLGLAALSALVAAFFLNGETFQIILAKLTFFFLFVYSILIFWAILSIKTMQIETVFLNTSRVLEKIVSYLSQLNDANTDGFHNKVKIISESIIEDEISSLGYQEKKAYLFHALFGFYCSFMTVFIAGDVFVSLIKWISVVLGFESFRFIQELSLESLAFFMFSVGATFSKYMRDSGLQYRNEKLRQSLVILRNRFGPFA